MQRTESSYTPTNPSKLRPPSLTSLRPTYSVTSLGLGLGGGGESLGHQRSGMAIVTPTVGGDSGDGNVRVRGRGGGRGRGEGGGTVSMPTSPLRSLGEWFEMPQTAQPFYNPTPATQSPSLISQSRTQSMSSTSTPTPTHTFTPGVHVQPQQKGGYTDNPFAISFSRYTPSHQVITPSTTAPSQLHINSFQHQSQPQGNRGGTTESVNPVRQQIKRSPSPPPGSGDHKPGKKKRVQVRVACTHCQKACKKCSNTRPCERCTKYGLKDCVDSVRKPRKTGVKRGPYRRRNSNFSSPPAYQLQQSLQQPSSPSTSTTTTTRWINGQRVQVQIPLSPPSQPHYLPAQQQAQQGVVHSGQIRPPRMTKNNLGHPDQGYAFPNQTLQQGVHNLPGQNRIQAPGDQQQLRTHTQGFGLPKTETQLQLGESGLGSMGITSTGGRRGSLFQHSFPIALDRPGSDDPFSRAVSPIHQGSSLAASLTLSKMANEGGGGLNFVGGAGSVEGGGEGGGGDDLQLSWRPNRQLSQIPESSSTIPDTKLDEGINPTQARASDQASSLTWEIGNLHQAQGQNNNQGQNQNGIMQDDNTSIIIGGDQNLPPGPRPDLLRLQSQPQIQRTQTSAQFQPQPQTQPHTQLNIHNLQIQSQPTSPTQPHSQPQFYSAPPSPLQSCDTVTPNSSNWEKFRSSFGIQGTFSPFDITMTHDKGQMETGFSLSDTHPSIPMPMSMSMSMTPSPTGSGYHTPAELMSKVRKPSLRTLIISGGGGLNGGGGMIDANTNVGSGISTPSGEMSPTLFNQPMSLDEGGIDIDFAFSQKGLLNGRNGGGGLNKLSRDVEDKAGGMDLDLDLSDRGAGGKTKDEVEGLNDVWGGFMGKETMGQEMEVEVGSGSSEVDKGFGMGMMGLESLPF